MRVYRGTMRCDVVFHTMLGMFVKEGGHRKFWIISEELQELVVGGCYGVKVWRHHHECRPEMVGTEAKVAASMSYWPLRSTKSELVHRKSTPRIGWETSARMNSHRKCCDLTFSYKVCLPKVWMALPLTAVRTGLQWPECVSELVAGSTLTCAPVSIRKFHPERQSWMKSEFSFVPAAMVTTISWPGHFPLW